MKNILVIDNYDSFTYNLVHYLEDLDCKVNVFRNDQIELKAIASYDKIVLSPGPGIPDEAGLLKPIIKAYAKTKSILGVCLGHQAIGQAFDADITYAKQIMHGKVSDIYHEGNTLFRDIESPFKATRYHSLIIDRKKFPKRQLDIIATLKDKTIMAVKHKECRGYGIQFHPESILTNSGKTILNNFLMV